MIIIVSDEGRYRTIGSNKKVSTNENYKNRGSWQIPADMMWRDFFNSTFLPRQLLTTIFVPESFRWHHWPETSRNILPNHNIVLSRYHIKLPYIIIYPHWFVLIKGMCLWKQRSCTLDTGSYCLVIQNLSWIRLRFYCALLSLLYYCQWDTLRH